MCTNSEELNKWHISQYCIIIIIMGKVRNHVPVSDDKLYLDCIVYWSTEKSVNYKLISITQLVD